MPFVGLGLHFLVALFFAVHAMRNGRQMYWLIILFTFPLLGSAVYFFAEYLPASKMERGLKKVSHQALALLNPTKELREARQAFDLTPTVQNRMRLAQALDNAGEYQEAVAQFEACLDGPFAKDPEVCFGAAKANFHVNKNDKTIALLLALRSQHADFRTEALSLLLARAYAALGQADNARKEFTHAITTYGSVESRAYYGIWAANFGDLTTATQQQASITKDSAHWSKHTRNLYKPLVYELNQAVQTNSPQ